MRSDRSQGPGAALSLRAIAKDFGGARAVEEVSLDIAAGEFVTLLGPSGSGKTTTLNMIAGFVAPSAGEILLDGTDISRTPAHRRGIGMVFQHYALFPHMTVAQNVAYPLKQRRVPKSERGTRVREALELVELGDLGERRPAQLSGGQQQRVALARALVYRPPVLLMDEPLGALDKRLRETLQLGIKQLHEELGITFVYVTHDQDEALLLSDRIAVFDAGRIEQVGTAEELYERPATRFVAEFLGDSNIFTGVLDRSAAAVRLDGEESVIYVSDCRGATPGGPAAVMVRPERMHVRPAGAGGDGNVLAAVVTAVRYVGSARKVELETPAGRALLALAPADRPLEVAPGDRAEVRWRGEDCVVIAQDATPAGVGGAAPTVVQLA